MLTTCIGFVVLRVLCSGSVEWLQRTCSAVVVEQKREGLVEMYVKSAVCEGTPQYETCSAMVLRAAFVFYVMCLPSVCEYALCDEQLLQCCIWSGYGSRSSSNEEQVGWALSVHRNNIQYVES